MLALHENALIAALKARPGLQNTLRQVDAIPNVPSEKLLAQYSTDAPAMYLAAPLLVVDNDMATMRFTLVIMVHNVGSRDQARKGNSQELGIDQYFTLACRTLNGKKIGEATWYVKRAEFADDAEPDQAARGSRHRRHRRDQGSVRRHRHDDVKHAHGTQRAQPHREQRAGRSHGWAEPGHVNKAFYMTVHTLFKTLHQWTSP